MTAKETRQVLCIGATATIQLQVEEECSHRIKLGPPISLFSLLVLRKGHSPRSILEDSTVRTLDTKALVWPRPISYQVAAPS